MQTRPKRCGVYGVLRGCTHTHIYIYVYTHRDALLLGITSLLFLPQFPQCFALLCPCSLGGKFQARKYSREKGACGLRTMATAPSACFITPGMENTPQSLHWVLYLILQSLGIFLWTHSMQDGSKENLPEALIHLQRSLNDSLIISLLL